MAKVVPLHPLAKRTGRGSTAGRLVLTDDWDPPETNQAVAQEFGSAQ